MGENEELFQFNMYNIFYYYFCIVLSLVNSIIFIKGMFFFIPRISVLPHSWFHSYSCLIDITPK